MKIKITKEIQVDKKHRPVIGTCYDVVHIDKIKGDLYFIIVRGKQVGVYPHECEVIDDE